MIKFIKICRLNYLLFSIYSLFITFFVAPEIIIIHFDVNGPDAFGSKYFILLLPILLVLLSEGCIKWENNVRRAAKLESIDVLTPFDCYLLSAILLITFVFFWLILDQVGITSMFD